VPITSAATVFATLCAFASTGVVVAVHEHHPGRQRQRAQQVEDFDGVDAAGLEVEHDGERRRFGEFDEVLAGAGDRPLVHDGRPVGPHGIEEPVVVSDDDDAAGRRHRPSIRSSRVRQLLRRVLSWNFRSHPGHRNGARIL